jgi:endoglucanase
MKRILFYLLAVAALYSCADVSSEEKFVIEKGVNIAHWLSQSGARGEFRANYFTEKDVRQIAQWGFDHVRIPIDEEQMFKEDGTKEEEAFALLHNALQLCGKYNLRAIVDLHILRSHYFNAAYKPLFTERAAQEAFFECWRKISDELKDYSTSMVAYELMNEPVADDPEDWNKLVRECHAVIRELEKDRVIVIGSNMWQSFRTAGQLAIPEGDPNIILSFHYYEPMILTHYQAGWMEYKDYAGEVNYPGQTVTPEQMAARPEAEQKAFGRWTSESYDKERFARDFKMAADVARSYGIPVYCGEYGCLSDEPNDAQRYRWLTDMNDVFDELGIARTVWCYREGEDGFGILSGLDGPVDQAMLDALLK